MSHCRAAPFSVGISCIVIGIVLSSCCADFVEAAPPVLESRVRELNLTPREEPIAFGLVFDLQIQDLATCIETTNTLASQVRQILARRSQDIVEITPFDLSPNCQQSDQRTFDYSQYLAAVSSAEATRGVPLRPILFYFNNVDLYLPFDLVKSFVSLNAVSAIPIIWAIAPPSALETRWYTKSATWKSATDTATQRLISDWADTTLPLVSRRGDDAANVLLLPDNTSNIHAFKICSAPVQIAMSDKFLDGRAWPFLPASPPRFTLIGANSWAVPKSDYAGEQARISIEVCHANCDRYVSVKSVGAVAWDEYPHCTLNAP